MKKFTIVAGSILTILIILFLVAMLSINSIVKSGIEEIGTEITGTTVTVENVSISPFSGKGMLSGFRVANPDDYNQPYAFQSDDFFIELDPLSLFTDEVIVHEIIITSPRIFVEQKLPENNILSIMQSIRNYPIGEATDTKLVIDHFLMTDGSAELFTEIGGERSVEVEVASVELHDLGRGGGREALEEVIMEIAEDVASEALKSAVQSGTEQLRDAFRKLID